MGHPSYIIKSGQVLWQGHNLLALSADKRARLGMFLAFQYPMAIPGLSVASFLRSAINARRAGLTPDPNIDPTDAFRGGIPMGEFRKLVKAKMALLKMDESIASRYVNEGFSGSRTAIWSISRRFFSPPENPSFTYLEAMDSSILRSSILERTSLRNSPIGLS